MKSIALTAILLLALIQIGGSAETGAPAQKAVRPEFPGLVLDSMGYPTNNALARARGRSDAQQDFTNGVLTLKTAGLPAPWTGEFDRLVEKRCHVRVDGLGGCMVSEGMTEYICGYDDIAYSYIGQKYGTNMLDNLEEEAQKNWQDVSNAQPQNYKVRAGDTLTKIARQHNITVKALHDANPKLDAARLRIGQKIVLPGSKTENILPGPQPAN